MVDFIGVDIPIPALTSNINWILILAIILFMIAGIIIIYVVLTMRAYNKTIILFENIAGQGYQVVLKDKARLIKVGDGGEEVLFLRKKKVFRTAYGKKMGKQTYWFAIGQDGYWYNIVLGDLDAKMGMLDIEPIDRDMRYMHVAIRKNIAERYRKVKFMEKYGTLIMGSVFFLIILIGLWLLLDKIGEISANSAGAVKAAADLQVVSKQIISSLDNICTGGAGIKPI